MIIWESKIKNNTKYKTLSCSAKFSLGQKILASLQIVLKGTINKRKLVQKSKNIKIMILVSMRMSGLKFLHKTSIGSSEKANSKSKRTLKNKKWIKKPETNNKLKFSWKSTILTTKHVRRKTPQRQKQAKSNKNLRNWRRKYLSLFLHKKVLKKRRKYPYPRKLASCM